MDVRELIERCLETVDRNQAELARRLGRSETTISRWVTGRNGIDYESALRIARMIGLPPRQVLEAAGLDAGLFPESSPARVDDADLSARKFAGALRGAPRRFWSVVVDASVALANAYGEAPVDAPAMPTRLSAEGAVSDQAIPPVRTPNSRANKRRDHTEPEIGISKHRLVLQALGAG